METKTKTFDAVEESRKWREATSRRLNAMSRDARIAHLNALGEKVRAELRPKPRLATAALLLMSKVKGVEH